MKDYWCKETKFTQDGSKFEQTTPQGAQTQDFFTCSGRFPAMTTIKEIQPYGYGSAFLNVGGPLGTREMQGSARVALH